MYVTSIRLISKKSLHSHEHFENLLNYINLWVYDIFLRCVIYFATFENLTIAFNVHSYTNFMSLPFIK